MLTAARLREVLHYDPVTGIWTWLKRAKGKRAGHVAPRGYRRIWVDGVPYYSHRLAFLCMNGEWPAEHVDHHNGTPGDDRWANIRAATRSQNLANSRRPRDNTSRFKGVSWDPKAEKWRAQIARDRKHLGYFDTPEAAHAAYVAAAEKHFGEFARAQ